MDYNERFKKGLEMRKTVLGEEYVNKSLENANEFNEDLQQLVTEFCWGDVWTRPGLSKQQRSMINLSMIAALNRPHELKIHVRGAINNGLTKEDIKEIFLQVAVYCGMPAALDSFRIAQEVFEEMDM